VGEPHDKADIHMVGLRGDARFPFYGCEWPIDVNGL